MMVILLLLTARSKVTQFELFAIAGIVVVVVVWQLLFDLYAFDCINSVDRRRISVLLLRVRSLSLLLL